MCSAEVSGSPALVRLHHIPAHRVLGPVLRVCPYPLFLCRACGCSCLYAMVFHGLVPRVSYFVIDYVANLKLSKFTDFSSHGSLS